MLEVQFFNLGYCDESEYTRVFCVSKYRGKIVGSGTHKELLKTNKIYKNLYETESLNS